MKTVECTFGQVELISIDRFLDLLSTKREGDKSRRVEFNTCMGFAMIDPKNPLDQETSNYERKAAFLFKGDTKSILKAALFYQATYDHMFNQSKAEVLEELIARHMIEMGETKYLVRIAPRTWMAASPSDFQILESKNGYGLAVLAKHRTSITQVNKLTLVQARRFMAAIMTTDVD